MQIEPSGEACGAFVTGINLSAPLSRAVIAELRAAWLQHHVLVFRGQDLNDDDLERFTLCFGQFGEDPFIGPIAGREHVIAVSRLAEEKAPLFAGTFHSDWSFQEKPPAGTCLYGITIPPRGGDTVFVNQHLALAKMPADLRSQLEGKIGIHSARGAYSPEGAYGDRDKASDRSMDILPSREADKTGTHPLIRKHPETGEPGLFSCLGYIIGIEGMPEGVARAVLTEMLAWQSRTEFQFRVTWQRGTLVMWDNRSVLHKASGGYEGFDRILHRTTIADHRVGA